LFGDDVVVPDLFDDGARFHIVFTGQAGGLSYRLLRPLTWSRFRSGRR
jgi:hypothetical protein